MKRFAATALSVILFSVAFVFGKGGSATPSWPDSLPSVYLYTEGIKQFAISGDSLLARAYLHEAIRRDSAYAPAYYALASAGLVESSAEAVDLARRAYQLDSTNKWYHQFYGQTLLMAERYDEALPVFRDLIAVDSKNPDFYRILAALYEQAKLPYSAITTLDSAEVLFGRIPQLGAQKRRLLVATRQYDKAIDEATALVEEVPYEAQNHVALAELYAVSGKDSLARAAYDAALKIDSMALPTLLSMADFYNEKHEYRSLLTVLRRLFESDALTLDFKIGRFERLTADTRFYREYYYQLDNLASTLIIRYPREKRVVELYAKHLIASGELERALALYKLHAAEDLPPQADYYSSIVDIEGYLQRPDSVDIYVNRALKLFPRQIDFHLAKGNSLSYAKDYDGAVDVYRRSLRYAQTDSVRAAVWGMIGDAWHLKSESLKPAAEHKRAIAASYDAYERSLKLVPDNALVLNNYAYFLAVEGRELERALAMSERVAELTGNNPTYMDTRAWVLFRLGRLDEAKKIIRQAVALDGQNSPELLVHYGDILDALGERFMAEIYWQKALDKGYDASAIERRMKSSQENTNER